MSRTPLIAVQQIAKTANARRLFDNFSFGIFEKEKIGLIGPNGSGKSSLVKILAGIENPEKGIRAVQRNLVIGYVPQNPQFPQQARVDEFLKWNFGRAGKTAEEIAVDLPIVLNRLGLAADTLISSLSGGWQKRLSILSELSKKPAVLLLDEPTNHLDLDGIKWLEKELRQFPGAFLLISHDRAFLENVCNQMVELHHRYADGYFACTGNYSHFLQKRGEYLHSLQQHEQALSNKVRREIEWLRQGVKARTTKSKARIQNAYELQDDLAETRAQLKTGAAKIDFSSTGKKSQDMIRAERISCEIAGKRLFTDFALDLRNGEKIGLLGPNGSGKSTLLKLLACKTAPSSGRVVWGEGVRVVYFEQDRTSLQMEKTLQQNLADATDSVIFQGRSLHINSYARRFLFEPSHLNLPVHRLSGGEQARLLIAKLMLVPADVLLLDEPTNDLDIDTMEILAENLLAFPGAVVLVSHDRYFMEQVCEKFLVIESGSRVESYTSIAQWEAERAQKTAQAENNAAKDPEPKKFRAKKRLSYNEKREFEQMEKKILVAEEALDRWKSTVEDPKIATSPDELRDAFRQMSEAQALVDQLYARWAELEQKQEE